MIKNTLIIGDTQIPYEREDYLPFVKAVAKKHKLSLIHI